MGLYMGGLITGGEFKTGILVLLAGTWAYIWEGL